MCHSRRAEGQGLTGKFFLSIVTEMLSSDSRGIDNLTSSHRFFGVSNLGLGRQEKKHIICGCLLGGFVLSPSRWRLRRKDWQSWWVFNMGVSINGGTPKWMVYKGKSHLEMDDDWVFGFSNYHLGLRLHDEVEVEQEILWKVRNK